MCCDIQNLMKLWRQLEQILNAVVCAGGKSVCVNRTSGRSFLLWSQPTLSSLCTDPVCPFLSGAEAVNEDALLFQLPESETLWEAFSRCDKMMRFRE